MYDPSGNKKRRYATMVSTAMLQYGLTLPYFNSDEPVSVDIRFILPRRRQDVILQDDGSSVLTQTAQTFPRMKDVDNLLKFVMDALQSVLYNNDVTITSVRVTKVFAENANARGCTELQFATSSQTPPLATGVWI
jgi:Holliday junction resolvase RusA-like endonuclease